MASQDGSTALMVAAMRGHSDTVGLLLDRGADMEAKNKVRLGRMLLRHAWHCSHEGSSFRHSDEDAGQTRSRGGMFASACVILVSL